MDFTILCDCCPDLLISVTNADLNAWKAVVNAGQITNITCKDCGCCYDPVDAGVTINKTDKSQPQITGILPNSGVLAGGTAVVLAGHRLDFGTLVVKFNGLLGLNLRDRADESATVDTPPAKISFRTGSVTGALLPGDVVTGDLSGKTAVVESVTVGSVVLTNLSGQFTAEEWLVKDVSNKVQLLGSLPSLSVDVTVENEFGQKVLGGKLKNGFSYT